MLIASFVARAFGTNCYLLAAASPGPCVVVDPGIGALPRLQELLDQHRLQPAAVVLTHGHIDHVASAPELSQRWDLPVYLHPADRWMLSDPAGGVGFDLTEIFGETFMFRPPSTVLDLPLDEPLRVAGVELAVDHAPGHTAGSVLLRTTAGADPLCLTGDVLFGGSIGRSDVPTGSGAEMARTLRERVLTQPDHTRVLPGHGPRTTIGAERSGNPFLRDAQAVPH